MGTVRQQPPRQVLRADAARPAAPQGGNGDVATLRQRSRPRARGHVIPNGVRRALRLPSSRERLARELEDEVHFHLERRVADLVARGMSDADARAEALRRFGDTEDLREYCETIQEHQMRRLRFNEWLEGWAHDIRFA